MSSPSQWRVFLTAKPSQSLPKSLLYLAHSIAWDLLQIDASEVHINSIDDSFNVNLISFLTTALNVSV